MLHVRMCRRIIQIIIQLLHILSMVALITRQSKQPFFQDRIFPIPQCDRKTYMLLVITNSSDPIFPPTIHTTARMIMRKGIPCIYILAVIFSHSSPLPRTQIWAPFSPAGLLQSLLFSIHDFSFLCSHLQCYYDTSVATLRSSVGNSYRLWPRISSGVTGIESLRGSLADTLIKYYL